VLRWITGSKGDHPLADAKQARALIAELPPYDSVKALDEITRWLESLVDADGFKLDRLYEVLDLLDSAAKNHHRKVSQDYLGMTRQQKFQENKLWSCGYKFTKALAYAYLHCLKQHESGAPGAAALKKQVPLVVARGVRSLGLQVKWTMLRFGPFETGLWTSISELYRHAEKGGYTTTPLTVYSGLNGNSTVQQEYLRIMMLWASSADVLPPLKQEIAERTVAHVAGAFRLGNTPFAGAIYCFDPTRNRPPTRMFGNAAKGEKLHYFGPGDAANRLAQLIPALEKTGKLPADINLGAPYPGDIVLGVFKHLALYWSDSPPARLSERRAASARITVVPGYFQLLDELERDETDALNFSVSGAESWVVENISENGYGALVPSTTTDWIRVDELIGVQLEGTPEWGIAVVRRVVRDEQRQYHVGIEMISRAVELVRITHGGREPENAVLLSSDPDANSEVGLVMRAGRFDPGSSIDLMLQGVRHALAPAHMVDAGDDFDWARYKITPA
jgi:hypothetical protein